MDHLGGSSSWGFRAAVGFGAALVVALVSSRLLIRSRIRKKKITRIIDTIDEFHKPTVRMKDPEKVEEIVCQLIKGGSSKLHVISDFDDTITRTHSQGKRHGTSYNALSMSPLVSHEYRTKARMLHDKYYPIEVDHSITLEEKIPLMIEWYTKAHENLKCSGIKKEDLPKLVQASNAKFRDGCDTLFDTLYAHKIPLLVFSAGLGDVVEELLSQNNALYPNTKVVSNFFKFDEEGKICGMKGDLIHMYNKNETSLKDEGYFEQIKGRNNVILMGDSLGDLNMSCGVHNINAILKIGFLNIKIEENLPQYLDGYDIVLVDDQSMDVINGLLRRIL